MTASVATGFPGNHQDDPSLAGDVYSFARVDLQDSTGAFVGSCGAAATDIVQDTGLATVSAGVSCADPTAAQYTLTLTACPSCPICFPGFPPASCIKATFAGRPVSTLENVTGSTSSSTLSYLTTDHLGTPILITNTSGSQVWQGGFEPFGADYSSSPTILRFPGQWVEDNSGLYYNVNRWYASGSGLYTQPDPAGIRDNLQPYVYVSSNPLRYIDPLGLSKITNNSCVQIYIKDENSSALIVVDPGHTGDGDGFYNSSHNSCVGFCGRGGGQGKPTPEVYKINDWTDVTITGGCNGGCLDFSTSGPISWASNILDPRTGWQGQDFLNKHHDWPKPPASCCVPSNWK